MFQLRLSHRSLALVAVPLLALTVAGAAQAQMTFHAFLTKDQETGATPTTPSVTSTGSPRPLSFGTATLTLNAAMTELSMTIDIFNIDVNGAQTPNDNNDNLGAAHIHAAAPPGTSAGVRWGFFGAPDNDIAPSDLVVTPFGPGLVGGTFTTVWNAGEGNAGATLTSSLPDIINGLSYLNFHTVQFGGGEIRGQILADAPEPGTLALMGGAAALTLAGVIRRRSRKSS